MTDAAQKITEYIGKAADWRGELLGRIRDLTLTADPELVEEWKWNSPVWSKDGLVVSASAFKDHVSVNFFQGAALPDPKGLFDGSSDAKSMRTIKLRQGEPLDEKAYREMVRAAVAYNLRGANKNAHVS